MSAIDAGVVEQTLEKYTPAGIVKDLRRVSIKANKAEGELVLLAEEVTDVGNKVSQLIVDVDSIELSFNKYENGELSGTKYVFDGDNATFYGGGLKIKNNDGDDVLYADTEGNLQLAGHIQMLQENEIVTVGTGGDFATINEALLFVQQKYPQFISGTNTVSSAEIRLKKIGRASWRERV